MIHNTNRTTSTPTQPDDVQGHAIDQYADNNPADPKQGHLHRGMPVGAGRDPAQVISQIGSDLLELIRPAGRYLPF